MTVVCREAFQWIRGKVEEMKTSTEEEQTLMDMIYASYMEQEKALKDALDVFIKACKSEHEAFDRIVSPAYDARHKAREISGVKQFLEAVSVAEDAIEEACKKANALMKTSPYKEIREAAEKVYQAKCVAIRNKHEEACKAAIDLYKEAANRLMLNK
ncbi:MAG: hypothetical protein A2469_00695 [Candidatus Magasanikbacteria bacterium RIFOXYC2_FULL_40_16]|uniref:Uncharacterized protein n=1 Tax=Candidatus Magasanikbacteria bacterium RIFOXYC2_FULL_40_16 TaxID=1798703 RepID=A0A1F6P124_9BACT|nr:MAG: hypothetical protein A2224_01610 [Candidatus Magasanikbacteria bacterium RIFOXYA2_FULL_40_20]OGH89865.1 MAG: hypothetical protein A2469_00695 [Candidatus Magasanikbacteria bacterium RIFOXYC2_FULL_40_16]